MPAVKQLIGSGPGHSRYSDQAAAAAYRNPIDAIKNLLGYPVIPGRKRGGTVASGGSYVVGESGPELSVPTSPGHILSNGLSKKVDGLFENGTNDDLMERVLLARLEAPNIMKKFRSNQPLQSGQYIGRPRSRNQVAGLGARRQNTNRGRVMARAGGTNADRMSSRVFGTNSSRMTERIRQQRAAAISGASVGMP